MDYKEFSKRNVINVKKKIQKLLLVFLLLIMV